MTWQRLVALAAVSAAALGVSPNALAGSTVRPVAGAVVAGPRPAFVVSLHADDQFPEVQIATSPATGEFGLTSGRMGFCNPPGGAGRSSCEPFQDLPDGTYYWLLRYTRDDRCLSVGAKKVCFLQTHITKVVRFRVSSRPSAPAPPAPQPPAAPPPPAPGPIPPPAGISPTGTLARPSDGASYSFKIAEAALYESQSVVVHSVTKGLDAPPLNDENAGGVPDYVEQIGAAADVAFAYYATRRQLLPVLTSGAAGAQTYRIVLAPR